MQVEDFVLARATDEENAVDARSNATTPVFMRAAAMRVTVADYRTFMDVAAKRDGARRAGQSQSLVADSIATGLRIALQRWATVYKDHPDFNEEWATKVG